MVRQNRILAANGLTAPWGPRAHWFTGRASATSAETIPGPGYMQNNASLFKTFVLRENWVLEARCDAFQLTNSPQFASPSSSFTSGTFGQVTSTVGSGTGINGIGGGRSLQLSATVRF